MHRNTLLLVSIIILAAILRFHDISNNPPGVTIDEALFSNLARCMLSTGRELNGVEMPFSTTGHYTLILPFHMYLNLISAYLFGPGLFSIRIVSALFGVLTVLAAFLLARIIFKNEKIAILTALLVAVSPFNVVYSRIGFQILQFTFFFTLGLYFLLKGIEGDRKWMYLGAFTISLPFYSYFLSHGFMVFFLLGFHAIYYDKIKSRGKSRNYFISILIILLLLILSILPVDLGLLTGPPPADSLSKFFYNVIDTVFEVFRPDGKWNTYLNVQTGAVYLTYIPFLILGLFLLLKERKPEHFLLAYWLGLSLLLAAGISDVDSESARRLMTCVGPVLDIIVAYAIYHSLKLSGSRWKKIILVVLVSSSLLFGVFTFIHYYFVTQHEDVKVEEVLMFNLMKVFNYTEYVKDDYERILISPSIYSHNFVITGTNGTEVNANEVLFNDYVLFYTSSCSFDGKYVYGNSTSMPVDGTTLFIVREYELVNETVLKFFRYSNSEIVYKAVA